MSQYNAPRTVHHTYSKSQKHETKNEKHTAKSTTKTKTTPRQKVKGRKQNSGKRARAQERANTSTRSYRAVYGSAVRLVAGHLYSCTRLVVALQEVANLTTYKREQAGSGVWYSIKFKYVRQNEPTRTCTNGVLNGKFPPQSVFLPELSYIGRVISPQVPYALVKENRARW